MKFSEGTICHILPEWVVHHFDRGMVRDSMNMLRESFSFVKVKLSLYRPWRPLELREVETPTFSDIRLTDGGKVVSPTPRPPLTPRKIPATHFS
jgi:hypothetical protein